MSRAAWAGLLLVGAGVGLVLFLLTRGLPEEHKARAQAVKTHFEASRASLAAATKEIDATVSQDAAYLGKRPEVAAARAEIARRLKALETLEKTYEAEIPAILEKDRYGDRGALITRSLSLEMASDELQAGTPAVTAPVRRLLHYKTHHKALVEEAHKQVRSVSDLAEDPTLIARVEAANAECPTAKAGFDKQLAGLRKQTAMIREGNARLSTLTAALPVDYIETGKQAEAIVTTANALRTAHQRLIDDLGSLAYSEDRILTDMRLKNGSAAHKYKDVRDGKATETSWVPVSRAMYDKHTEHLGMAIKSKPECVPQSEATVAASPPGYAYIGNSRYGKWERRNGHSFWVFYGRYSLMRDLFWGPSYYRPISRTTWRSYRSNASRGKAWYGEKRQYGTSGTRTRTRYANSSHFKTQRTKYRSSKYSGSSGSSRSGSSYRSSGSRSSSFGGSGK